MSGGSYNYLFSQTDIDGFIARIEDLENMVIDLEQEFPNTWVTQHSRMFLDRLRAYRATGYLIAREADSLRATWREMEWWQSNDTSRDDAVEQVVAYERAVRGK